MEMYNVVVGDKGKKSVNVGVVWYDATRKAIISGYISKTKLSKALADGNLSTSKGEAKTRLFEGDDIFRLACFPIRGRSAPKSDLADAL